MVKSYNDPVKQKAREHLRDFIAKHLLPRRKARDIKVVCFPGAEQEGEEAIEVKEVYDPLGIPHSNIIGLEADPKVAERLRKANIGIRVEEAYDAEFFKKTDRRFDIISLDYKCIKKKEVQDSIASIADGGLLNALGIISINNYARQESPEKQDFLRKTAIRSKPVAEESNGLPSTKSYVDMYMEQTKMLERRADIALKDARDMFTFNLIRIMHLGSLARWDYDLEHRFLTAYPDSKNTYQEILRKYAGLPEHESAQLTMTAHIDNFESHLREILHLDRIETTETDRFVPIYWASFLRKAMAGGYSCTAIERLSYQSNSGSYMEMDNVQFSNFKKYTERIHQYFTVKEINGERIFTLTTPFLQMDRKDRKHLMETMQEIAYAGFKEYCSIHSIPTREYLGSSYSPPKKNERITREDAIDLLQSGCSIDEICKCYSGFSRSQLAAFKAHVTMGTYK